MKKEQFRPTHTGSARAAHQKQKEKDDALARRQKGAPKYKTAQRPLLLSGGRTALAICLEGDLLSVLVKDAFGGKSWHALPALKIENAVWHEWATTAFESAHKKTQKDPLRKEG